MWLNYDWPRAHAAAQKEGQYTFGNQEHSDERVNSLIQGALNTADGDTFSAWSDLYDRRFGENNPDPTNVNLAAAEHYMFARDFTKTKWYGGASLSFAIPAKTYWKKYGRPLFGIPNASAPSTFEIRWGNQGIQDGLGDRGWPTFGICYAGCSSE